jgi:LacI family transcriptional regulator
MAVTLKDLARYLNLSPATVSRALNNKGRMREETRKRVIRAANTFNYRPNDTARTLKTKRSSTIGVIIPDAANVFYSIMLKSIDKELLKIGFSTIFCDSDESIERETEYFYILKSKQVSSMIIVTAGNNDIYNTENSLANIVFVDNLPRIDREFSSVSINNVKAAYELAQLVIDHGHKDIAVICGDLSETTSHGRLEGFKQCVMDNGLEHNMNNISHGSFRYQSGYDAMKKILQKSNKPTSIFAQNNMLAYGAIQALHEASFLIPDDISVVCFDAIDETGMMVPKLTCVMQPVEEIGRTAVSSFMRNIESEQEPVEFSEIVLDYTICMGDSLKKIDH